MKTTSYLLMMTLLMLLGAWHTAAAADKILLDRSAASPPKVDPYAIQAIAFPADRAAFANGSAVPAGLHVLCGWWDRADSFADDPLRGSCDFVRANYAGEHNLTCYASDPRLVIDRANVTCAVEAPADGSSSGGLAAERRFAAPGHSLYGVVQDSCALVIDAAHWQALPTTFRAPDTYVPMDERPMYDRARDAYAHLLHRQIVALRHPVKLYVCLFNGTRITDVGHRIAANAWRVHRERIGVEEALNIVASPERSEKDVTDLLHFAFAVVVEILAAAVCGGIVVAACYVLRWVLWTAVRTVCICRHIGAALFPISMVLVLVGSMIFMMVHIIIRDILS